MRSASRICTPRLILAGLIVAATSSVVGQRGASGDPDLHPTAQKTRGGEPDVPDGNPARGKALTESSKCLDCHRIGEAGSRLGPDLSQVGTRRSRELLHQALVAPDDEVLPEHRFMRVVTSDGTVVAGKLLNQDAFTVQLMTPDERLRSFQKSSLREHAIQQKGLMPSYEGKLTPQQLADIVSYMETLKGAEK
jgi:quinoprotein glucose dehydrogenase